MERWLERVPPGACRGTHLGTGSKQREIPPRSLLCWGALLQQGEEPGDMPTGSCLHRLPGRLPALRGSALYPQVMPCRICTTQHLSKMNLVPVSLPFCSVSPTFSAALHTGSTLPSPEQLSISGGFCCVTIHPYFQIMVFDWFCPRTIGPVGSVEHPLPGQLSRPLFHSRGAQSHVPIHFFPYYCWCF